MPATKRLLSVVAVAMLITGCGSQPIKVPEVVKVPVEVPVKVTDDTRKLLADCPIEEPTNWSVEELRRVAGMRKLQLQVCNEDKAGLRKIVDPGR